MVSFLVTQKLGGRQQDFAFSAVYGTFKFSVIPFIYFKFLLEYNCFTMLCWFLLYSKVSHLYVQLFFFQILFPYRSLQSPEYSSACYTVGPYWCICVDPTSQLITPSLFHLVTISLFSYICDTFFILYTNSFVPFFRFHI